MADEWVGDRPRQVDGVSAAPRADALVLVLGIIATLYFGREVFVPVALAVLLSFVLAPLVRRLQSWGVPRAPSVVAAVLFAFLLIVAIGTVVASQLSQLASNLPAYQTTMREKITAIRTAAGSGGPLDRALEVIQDLGKELKRAPPAGRGASGLKPTDGDEQKPIPVELHQPDPGPVETLTAVMKPLVHPLATVGIVLVFVVFILLQREDLRNRLIRLAGAYDLQRTTAAINDAADRLSRLFLRQVMLNAAFGLTVGIGLWVIGVPNPVIWGILAAISRFVPYVGAIIAASFPIVLAAAVDPGWSMLAATIALLLVIELLTGQVIEPLLYGHSTGLSPIAVIVSATFWTWLWGPIGLLLSTPLTVLLVVLGRHVERLEFLDVMLGDKPPLSAAETFYQRILAGDPDEAIRQAEEFLKQHTLASYYDEVALNGLKLAQTDIARGALDPVRLARVEEALHGLIEDLSDHDDERPAVTKPAEQDNGQNPEVDAPDTTPQPGISLPVLRREEIQPRWQGDSAVLCIGGRNALDKASGAMLVQLIQKHGLGARLEGAESLSTTRIASLDTSGVALVCLSYLDASSPVHLRSVIRRLRRKLPDAPILVGCWQLSDSQATALTEAAKGDLTATTLTQALEMCLAGAAGAPIERAAPLPGLAASGGGLAPRPHLAVVAGPSAATR